MLTLIALVIALLFLSWPWNVILVATAAMIDVAEMGLFVWWSRRRRRHGPAAVGTVTLVGRRARALTRFGAAGDPPGQVRIEGEIWAARADEPIDPGVLVTVKAVHDLELEVERDPGA